MNSADRYLTANGCLPFNLLEDVGASSTNDNLENRIIPILEKGLPTSNLWNLGLTQDKANNSDKNRVWSFDDTGSLDDCIAIAAAVIPIQPAPKSVKTWKKMAVLSSA